MAKTINIVIAGNSIKALDKEIRKAKERSRDAFLWRICRSAVIGATIKGDYDNPYYSENYPNNICLEIVEAILGERLHRLEEYSIYGSFPCKRNEYRISGIDDYADEIFNKVVRYRPTIKACDPNYWGQDYIYQYHYNQILLLGDYAYYLCDYRLVKRRVDEIKLHKVELFRKI